jgi:hypothetical protein
MGAAISDAQKPDNNQTLNLSSQQFGLYGPLGFNLQYSKELGVFVQGKFTQLINPLFAMSLDVEAGKNTRRVNGTFGYLLTPRQRLKLSAEYLTQNLDFDFASGNVRKWIGQDAYGLTYEYLLPKGWLRSFGFNTFYSKSQSENLDPKLYQDGSGGWYENFRRIAGAVDKHGGLTVNLLPTKLTLLDLELGYDYLKYNKPGEKNSSLGFKINLQQLISNRLKLQLLADNLAAYQDYEAEVDFLVPSMLDTRLELGLNGKRILGNHGLQNDTQVGVNVNFRWGLKRTRKIAGYNLDLADNFNDLAAWSADPAVYMQQVLAVKDEYNKLIGGGPFANSNISLHDITIPYGQFFSKSYKALDLFIDPVQKADSLEVKAEGEEAIGLHAFFAHDSNHHDNGTLTIYGVPSNKITANKGDEGAHVIIYARNYENAPAHWSSSTRKFNINVNSVAPDVNIPAQIFHLGQVVNNDLTSYIEFNSNKLSSVQANSLGNYGLQINLSKNGKQVSLTGTANKGADNVDIPITVTNSGYKTTNSRFKLTIHDPVIGTLTCPEPDTQFHYDQQWCAQHPNEPVDYYGESGEYKFELNHRDYGTIYCNYIPKPGELRFFGAAIIRNVNGVFLVCRYQYHEERQWETIKTLPKHSVFHNQPSNDYGCGTPNHPKSIEQCKVDLKP